MLLDAFRGAAVLWIVGFHILVGNREHYGSILNFIISKGMLGVSIFFVISGFGIALSLDRALVANETAYMFLKRRLKRIYLTYWFHLIFAALIIPVLSAFVSMLKSNSLVFNFFEYSFWEWIQIVTLIKVFSATSWKLNLAFVPLNGVLWYLSIIVQIYIVVSLSICFKNKCQVFLFTLFLLSLVTLISNVKMLLPYGFFLPYFNQFYVGIILYFLLKKSFIFKLQLKYFFITVLPIFVLISCVVLHLFFSVFTFSCLVGFLFWILYSYDVEFMKYKAVRVFGVVGSFSYSLYLLHIPLWPFVGMFVRNFVPISAHVAAPFVVIPLVLFSSFVWYLFFEKQASISKTICALKNPIDTMLQARVINYISGSMV